MTTPTLAANKGFTLLELLVVLALIAIGSALLIPNLATTANGQFNAEIRQASAILRNARRLAIVQAKPQTVHFTALDRSAANFDQQLAQATAQRSATDWFSDSISLAFQEERNQHQAEQDKIDIVFFPQGGSTGGVIHFVQSERHGQIRIDPLTGRIAAAYNGESLDDEVLDAAF
jgi:general secretion pathway protein H